MPDKWDVRLLELARFVLAVYGALRWALGEDGAVGETLRHLRQDEEEGAVGDGPR